MAEIEIACDDPRATDVSSLLRQHLAFANEHTAPEDIHALDIDGLLDPAVTFYSYRSDGRLLAVGALKQLDGTHAEVKSMHTAREARGHGIGRAMVEHLIGVARQRVVTRLSLETGAMAAFAPARALYASGVHAMRAVRRLPPEPEQRLHDAGLATNSSTPPRRR